MTNPRSLGFWIFWTLIVALIATGVILFIRRGSETTLGAATPASSVDPNAVVLRLGDTEVTVAEFEPRFNLAIRALAAEEGATLNSATLEDFAHLRPSFLYQFATQQVLLQEAQVRDLDVPSAEVDAQLTQAKEGAEENFAQSLIQAGHEDEAALRQTIHETLLLEQVVASLRDEVEVGDDELRQYYDQNLDLFTQPQQACIRHILVDTKATADKLYAQIQSGSDFAELAKTNSRDPGNRDDGGDLGCLTPGETTPPFNKVAFIAKVGETTPPVKSEDGFHIMRVYEKKPAVVAPFPQVRAQLRERVAEQQVDDQITELREASGLELFPENLPNTIPTLPTSVQPTPANEPTS